MPSAAPAVKKAVKNALTLAFAADADVLVLHGHPGYPLPENPDIVTVIGVSTEAEPGPLGPARRRDETLRVSVTLSSFVAGGPEAQTTADDRAYVLLAAIESALRTDPTLGGVCTEAAVESHESVDSVLPEVLATGRATDVFAVIRAKARI